jgi:gliding motility-associated-like protein
MRVFISLLILCFSIGLQAQFFVNPGGVVGIQQGAVVTVQNMDAENFGDISHAGDLEVTGNIINSGLWVCSPANKNRISLTLDWTNTSFFNPGIGRVEFNGGNQNIGGNIETRFNNLVLRGTSGNQKTLLINSQCLDSLYLTDVELATNGNRFTLRNASVIIQRNSGYISTLNNGVVRAIFPVALNTNREIPLGFGTLAANYKPLYLVAASQDSFDMTLFGNSPDIDGRSSTALQDSLCSINDNYYYRIQTYGNPIFYGMRRNASELQFTKLARWNGLVWDKIPGSGPTSFIPVQNLAFNSQLSSLTEFVTQAKERPYVNAGPDIGLLPGSKKQFNPTGYFPIGSTFLWDPGLDLSCTDCLDPTFTMGTPGIYTIKVSNGPNCEAVDSLRIFQIGNYSDLIANAFSPNGDRLNDEFGPKLFPGDQLISLEIYNRWGEMLYSGTQSWDGTYLGTPVQEGAYLYKLFIKGPSEGRHFYLSGSVTVVR